MDESFAFESELWRWEGGGEAAWFFVTVPADVSHDIRELPRMPRGFGSVRVRVTAGGSSWATSVFPDSKTGCYLLPIKKAVRTAEGIEEGDVVAIELDTVD